MIALALALAALLSSCDNSANTLADSSVPVNISDVPVQATDYIQTTFNGLTIVKVEMKLNSDGSVKKYEVYLSNGVELYFDANWNLLGDDDDDDDDSDDDNSGSGSGDDDDSDDDDSDDDNSGSGGDDSFNIAFSDLPQVSQDYVTQNYPDESIKKIRKKLNDAGNVRLYEVRFESG
ncbi:MAG: hypothetical protein EAZ89_15910, partial [Bacteroidetes bacterium]